MVRELLSSLNSFGANLLISKDNLSNVVAVNPSTDKHERARIRNFAIRDNGIDEVVGYYYGRNIYSKTEVPWSGNVLEEGLVSVTKHDFQNLAIRQAQKTKCFDARIFKIWLLLAKFKIIRFINDSNLF